MRQDLLQRENMVFGKVSQEESLKVQIMYLECPPYTWLFPRSRREQPFHC